MDQEQEKKTRRTEEKQKEKEYRYYDGTHKKYINVPDDLKPYLKKNDRYTRYIEGEQNRHNNVYEFSELSSFHEKYLSYTDPGYEKVLDEYDNSKKKSKEKFWADIDSVLTKEQKRFLIKCCFKKKGKKDPPRYKTDDYEKNKSKRRRIIKKLKKYYKNNGGDDYPMVHERYFGYKPKFVKK